VNKALMTVATQNNPNL